MAQLVDAIKSEPVDEATNMLWNGDWLVARDRAQRAAVEMIEMGMSDQNQVDRWKIAKFDSGVLDPLDDLQPLRPIWVYQDALLGSLNEE